MRTPMRTTQAQFQNLNAAVSRRVPVKPFPCHVAIAASTQSCRDGIDAIRLMVGVRDLCACDRRGATVVCHTSCARFSRCSPAQRERQVAAYSVMGLEGIVAKRRDSRYRSGRCRDWVKIKNIAHPAIEGAMLIALSKQRQRGG